MHNPSGPRKLAILFRYGAREHVDFLPALPGLVQRLRQRGWDVHHFGFSGAPGSTEANRVGDLMVHEGPFRVRRSNAVDKWIKAGLWLLYLPWLGRRLQKKGFDRVFVDETLPLSAGLLRLGYKGALSFTVHDFFTEIYITPHSLLRPLGRFMQRADENAWRKLDHVFTRVEPAKHALVRKGIPPEKISVAPDSVDLDRFHPLRETRERDRVRARYGIGPEDLVMVHHGILHPNKGNTRLVHALFRLRYRVPRLKLLIIGEGREKRLVELAAHTRGVAERVVLTGWVPDLDEIAALLRASDIGLVMRKGLPGDHFHVTSTLVHNMASGLPILAARLDGIVSVMGEDDACGFLFDPECGKEFDERLQTLAASETLRQRMGRQARDRAETQFSPEIIADLYLDTLTRAPAVGG